MRIIGGVLRGRRLEAPAGTTTRPTSDRTREAIFNILAHSDWGIAAVSPLADARVLDGFCGSGALGLEAVSRGAAQAQFWDTDSRALESCRRNCAALGVSDRCVVRRQDARHPPSSVSVPALARSTPSAGGFTLVFLDPPYGQGLVAPTLSGLHGHNLLTPGAVLVVEQGLDDPPPWGMLESAPEFLQLDTRRYRDTSVFFLGYGWIGDRRMG